MTNEHRSSIPTTNPYGVCMIAIRFIFGAHAARTECECILQHSVYCICMEYWPSIVRFGVSVEYRGLYEKQ